MTKEELKKLAEEWNDDLKKDKPVFDKYVKHFYDKGLLAVAEAVALGDIPFWKEDFPEGKLKDRLMEFSISQSDLSSYLVDLDEV